MCLFCLPPAYFLVSKEAIVVKKAFFLILAVLLLVAGTLRLSGMVGMVWADAWKEFVRGSISYALALWFFFKAIREFNS